MDKASISKEDYEKYATFNEIVETECNLILLELNKINPIKHAGYYSVIDITTDGIFLEYEEDSHGCSTGDITFNEYIDSDLVYDLDIRKKYLQELKNKKAEAEAEKQLIVSEEELKVKVMARRRKYELGELERLKQKYES